MKRLAVAIFLVYLVVLALALVLVAVALPAQGSTGQAVAAVRIPPASAMYRLWVEQAAAEQWGVQASPARLAAQIHQESAWRPDAKSHAGAMGMAQFMPGTAKWIAERFPNQLGGYDPWDPRQAIRAAAIYDAFLFERIRPMAGGELSDCSRWAFTMRAYNGGEGWVRRERALAQAAGADANDWLVVERFRARAVWAHRENTHYPRRILTVLEPAYVAAGWPGQPVCA